MQSALHTRQILTIFSIFHSCERSVNSYMTFNNLWRKKWTPSRLLSALPYNTMFSSSLETCPDILLWLINPDIWVQWWEVHGEEAEKWKLHLPSMVFLLRPSQMRHVFDAEAELRASLWCQQRKLCVCTCLSVCSVLHVRGKVEVSIQVAWVILAFPSSSSIQVLDHKSYPLLLLHKY